MSIPSKMYDVRCTIIITMFLFLATRLNWYRNSKEWKPFHHDAAAIKPDKAKTQNLTVGVSFGAERDAAFEHAKTKTVMSMPQPNGTIYVFAKDVNIIWRHGILQVLKDYAIVTNFCGYLKNFALF